MNGEAEAHPNSSIARLKDRVSAVEVLSQDMFSVIRETQEAVRANEQTLRASIEASERESADFRERSDRHLRKRNRRLDVSFFLLMLMAVLQAYLGYTVWSQSDDQIVELSQRTDSTASSLEEIEARLDVFERSRGASADGATFGALVDRVKKVERAIILSPDEVVSVATLRAEVEAQRETSELNYALLREADSQTSQLLIGLFGALLVAIVVSMVLRE